MSRLLAVSALLLALALPASTQASCRHRGENVQASSSEAVVLVTPSHRGDKQLVGCLRRGARRVRLEHLFGSGDGASRTVWPLRLDGTVVSWGWREGDRYGTSGVGVATRDLRRGGTRRLTLSGYGQEPRDVVGGPGGALAWSTPLGVYVASGRQAIRVDRGPADALTDLAIVGADVTWNHAGVAQHSPRTPQLAGCALTPDLYSVTSTTEAVLAFRNSGIGGTSRNEAVACLRSSADGFVAIGQRDARIAGAVAAAAQNDGDTLTIVAVDLTSGVRIGVPVTIDRFAAWDLAADGTIVTLQDRFIVAHAPDDRLVVLGPSSGGNLMVVDDQTRTVTWGPLRAALPTV